MMIEEFEKRTGIFPDMETYRVIEAYYCEFDGDKDAFCKAFKTNKNGLAEQIQREVNSCRWKAEREVKAEETRLTSEIERLKKELERAKADLDREQEWEPYNQARTPAPQWRHPGRHHPTEARPQKPARLPPLLLAKSRGAQRLADEARH